MTILEAETSRARRDSRYRARELLNGLTTLKRLKVCGAHRVTGDGVPVVLNAGRAHYRNLALCASVHACPVCAAKIRSTRADEVAYAVRRHLEAGGGVEFVTVTLPHDYGDELARLLATVTAAWRRVTVGRSWTDDRAMFGINGSIRALEVTHGPNGWHPHLHVLFFTRRPLAARHRRLLELAVFNRWRAGVTAAGLRPPTFTNGIDVRPVRTSAGIGEYVSKVALELSRTDLKLGRISDHRGAFQVLADLVANGEVRDLELWWEYERATRGRRALVWSPGLKARYGVQAHTDEELAAADPGGVVVAVVGAALWPYVARRRGARLAILQAAELDGAMGVHELLARYELAVFGELLPAAVPVGDFNGRREEWQLAIERAACRHRARRGEPWRDPLAPAPRHASVSTS